MTRMLAMPPFTNTAVLSALAFLVSASVAEARQVPSPTPPSVGTCQKRATNEATFNGFSIYEENDSFVRGDEGYTQGLRVALTQNPKAHPCWVQSTELWRLPGSGGDKFNATLSYLVGQGLYTPRLITSPVPLTNDRGFADYNYVGASLSLTSNDETLRYTAEASLGALGVPSLAKATQGGLHALKLHRIPKGWPTSSPNGLGIYTRMQLEKKFAWTAPVYELGSDFVVGPAVELGTVRSAAAIGGVVRVGRALSGFGPATIPPGAFSTARPRIEVGVMLGIEGRAVANTSLVSATPGSTGFNMKRLVNDVRGGGFLRWEDFRVSMLEVRRSAEFAIVGQRIRSQRFRALSLGYEPSNVRKPYLDSWMFADWSAELGMGRNLRGPKLDVGEPRGVAAQIAVRKGLWKGLTMGVEAVVMTAEALPTVRDAVIRADVRPDVILRQQIATLGWGQDTKFGHLGVRAGPAWATKARVQTMLYELKDGQVEEAPRDQDLKPRAGGWMYGVQYFLPLERRMSIGFDISHHDLKLSGPLPSLRESAFWKAVVLLRVRRSPSVSVPLEN